jgi:hypothetical protein
MVLNTTATISADVVFQQQETDGNTFDNRQGSLGYSTGVTSGTGSLKINAIYNLQTASVSSGSSYATNFFALTQDIVGGSMPMVFNNLKTIVVENLSHTTGEDLSIRATGSNPLTEIFNGASGNLLIKPASTYMYSDIYTGATIDTSNKNLQVTNLGTGNILFNIIAIGVTG